MANKIQIRRGLKANLPTLSIGEPAITTDTEQVYVGGNSGNIELAKAADLSEKANPNILINSYFKKAVNQRGLTNYSVNANGIYTIDRWMLLSFGSATLIVNDGYITMSNTSVVNTYLQQKFDTEFSKLNGNKFTLTIKYRTSLSKVKVSAFGVANYITSNSNWTTSSFTIDISNWLYALNSNDSSILVQLYDGTSMLNGSIDIEYIKLEQGSIATPFVPRFYTEELALCQRYFEKKTAVSLTIPTLTDYAGTSLDLGSIQYNNIKRTAPTLTFSNIWFNGWYDQLSVPQNLITSMENTNNVFSSLITSANAGANFNNYKGKTVRFDYVADAEIY